MARASYRRRPDGVLEIVRPHPLQRMGRKLKPVAAALIVLAAALGGAGLYALVGMPVVLVAGCAVFAAVLWRAGQPKDPAGPVRTTGERRTAP